MVEENQMEGVQSIDDLLKNTRSIDENLRNGNYASTMGAIHMNDPAKAYGAIEQMMYGMMAVQLAEAYGLGLEGEPAYGNKSSKRTQALREFLDDDGAESMLKNYGLSSPVAKEYAAKMVHEYAVKAGIAQGPELPASYRSGPGMSPAASYAGKKPDTGYKA